ncbi:MAG: TIGR03936 family radical SAM-associated protein [Chloroflexota bacterium]
MTTERRADETPIVQRLHIIFGKHGALKYTGNLDVSKVWERVLRRANLPILYTQGFNTRPRIQLATALPLGITSDCEIIDVALRERLPTLDGISQQLEAVAPDGLKVVRVDDVPVNSPPLQTSVRSAEYRIHFEDAIAPEVLRERVMALLARDRVIKEIVRKRRKSYVDLRPLILELIVDEAGDLIAHLATGERGSMRPDEVLVEMGLEAYHVRVHRFALHLEDYAHHTRLRDHERDMDS